MPEVVACVSDSTSPPCTRTLVVVELPTNASTCSPGAASAATSVARSSSSCSSAWLIAPPSSPGGRSGPRHRPVGYDQGHAGGARRQPGQVGAHGDDVAQQPRQRRGDRELAQRLGRLAAPDPPAL